MLGTDIDPDLIQIARKQSTLCERLQFEHCDIVMNSSPIEKYLRNSQAQGFDIIFCFSVTMWIHLNKGQQGLEVLFKNCGQMCKRFLVLEPQPWKCYMTAARRMRKLKQPKFDHLDEIEHRQDKLIPHLILLCETFGGFKLKTQLGKTNWDRKILLFEKI